MKIVKQIYIFSFLLLSIFFACVKQPSEPEFVPLTEAKNGAFILCEGVWGMDNSSLSRYDFLTHTVISDFYKLANRGYHLGDLANDIVLKNDTAYIAVTSAKAVISINVRTGKFLDSMILTGNHAPRKICIVDDENAFVSDLYSHSVIQFNPKTMKFIKEIPVGPAPEGLANSEIYLFAANSGYGDYLAGKPKAGSISVIDVLSGTEIKNIYAGPNISELKINKKRNSLFASYKNLPSKKNEVGGIIEFDLNSLVQKRKWETVVTGLTFSATQDTLFFLNKTGVAFLDLKMESPKIEQLINNPNPNDVWYSLAVSANDNSFWVGNARNYQVNGEILIFALNYPYGFISKFDVGINPNTIIFY